MAYTEAGAKVPRGDLYAIEGFDRRLVKIAVNIMFNAESRRSAILATAKALHDDPTLCAASGLRAHQMWWTYQTFSKNLLEAIEHRHRRIEDYFNSDCGARFQRLDSDMAIEVMTLMIRRTGRCPLPVHDSFLVPDTDTESLKDTMTQVAAEHGLVVNLKESRPITTTIQDLISRHSPLLPHTTTTHQPQPPIYNPPTPTQPPAAIHLEVTTPELQGLSGLIEPVEDLWDNPQARTHCVTEGLGPTSPVQKPKCHDPPQASRSLPISHDAVAEPPDRSLPAIS